MNKNKIKQPNAKKEAKTGKPSINFSRPTNSNKGLSAYFDEIVRISFKNGLMCFCTPGHNRGAAQHTMSMTSSSS